MSSPRPDRAHDRHDLPASDAPPRGAPPGDDQAHDAPAVPRRRLVRGVLIAVPLAALAYALLVTAPGLEEVRTAVDQFQPAFLPLALAGEAVHILAMGQAYRSALAALDVRLPYRRQLSAFLAGYGVGQLLPAGGAVGGAVVGQRMIAHGAPRAAAAAAVALTGTLSLLSVALVVTLGLAVAALVGSATPSLLALAVVASALLTVVVGVVLAVVRSPRRGRLLLDRFAGVMRRVGADLPAWRRSLDELAASPPTTAGVGRIILWAAVAWLGNAGVLWSVFAGLGAPLDAEVLLAGFGLQHVVAMIPVSPGGLGLVEAGMAGTYTALGVAGSTAVTGVVGYRLVSFWLPVAIGLTTYYRTLAPSSAPSSGAR